MTEELEGRGQRLHGSSLLFEVGKSFFSIVVMGVVVLFLAARDRGEAVYMLVFVPVLLRAVVRYLSLRFWLTDEHLVVREGILFKTVRHVPFARLQNVDTVQGPLHRLLDVVEVRLETASGTEPEAVLRVVSTDTLRALRERVFPVRPAALSGDAAEPPSGVTEPRPVFRMGALDVILFGLLSQKGLAYVTGALVLLNELFGVDEERLRAWLARAGAEELYATRPWTLAAGVVGFLLLLQVATVAWAFVTLYGFRVIRRGDDLQAICGLWTRQSATIAKRRIQTLSLREGIFQRLFRRAAVKVRTAGGDSTRENHISRKWIVPLAARSQVRAVLDEVQPEARFEDVAWQGVHPRAARRMFRRWLLVLILPQAFLVWQFGPWALLAAPLLAVWGALLARLRAQRLAWAFTGAAFFVRDGRLAWTRTCVRFSKIQSVSYLQTPFDRRHGMATLRIDTAGAAGGELELAVPYLAEDTAKELLRRLREAAQAVSFRW